MQICLLSMSEKMINFYSLKYILPNFCKKIKYNEQNYAKNGHLNVNRKFLNKIGQLRLYSTQ